MRWRRISEHGGVRRLYIPRYNAILVILSGDRIDTRCAAAGLGAELARPNRPTRELPKTALCLPKRRFAR
jgi:hypothetical protein